MRALGNVIKSQSDNRLYKAIKLKNDIQCLIISDNDAKKSSAAMSVGVGSLQDPIQAQGLAHYLQHMLFMGTTKYPNENDYSNFIAKNFGQSNAYTSQQQTNYFFQVSSNAFKQTLDRFAQFFISPLMSDSSSQRQLNAVHSEHSKNILNDMWRKYQLTKFLAKQNHPYNKFSTGNKQSLSNPNLRSMLHAFYNKNYSSNLMKLVVCGNQTPDQMSKIIQQKFSDVPNKQYNQYQMLQQPYDKNRFQKMYKIAPIQDKKLLEISWMLKDKSKYYENPPATYLSYILGHQGQGSLLSFLIKEGLATGLSAGGHDSYKCFSQFQIKISLTKKGVQHTKQIIQYVLYFIQMIKKQQPRKWVYDQLKNINKMKFDYMEKKQGMNYASGLAKKLHTRKVQQVLIYPYFMKQWRPDLIKEYLSQIVKQNIMIFLEAKEVQNDCKSIQPIYKTKFSISDLQNLEPRVCPVSFPTQNPFIPKNFQILSLKQQNIPQIIQKSNQFEVFYKPDSKFQLPKMLFKLRLYFQGINSVRQSLCRQIYLDMLIQSMRQFTYLGDSAQTQSAVDFDCYYSLSIDFYGFRDSTLRFVQPYLQKIFQFQPKDSKYFQTVKQKMQRALSNYFLGDPYRLAHNLTTMATRHGVGGSPMQKLKQINTITLDDVVQFGKNWSKKLYVQSYISGNVNQKQAQNVFNQAKKLIESQASALNKNLIGDIRAVKMPSQFTWIIQQKLQNKKQQNSAVIVHFQHQASTLRSKILQDLAYNFIKQPAFDYLRTKQQLGYIVMCLPDDNRGVLGMSILVQSSIKTSYQLISYVDTFVNKVLFEKLAQLDQSTLEQYKNSLLMTKLQKDKTLASQASRFWVQIARHRYMFDRKQKEIQQIKSIKLQQFKNFINLIFYLNAKRLQIHLMSTKNEERNQQLKNERINKNSNLRIFQNADSFRKKMDLYPDLYAHL